MSKVNVIGVDLAKNVIQVSVVSRFNRELCNHLCVRERKLMVSGTHRLNPQPKAAIRYGDKSLNRQFLHIA